MGKTVVNLKVQSFGCADFNYKLEGLDVSAACRGLSLFV